MIYISHRGNTRGPTQDENNPNRILEIAGKYDVEIDVRYVNGELWLGHDEPQHKINDYFLSLRGLWCHAKDKSALYYMLRIPHIHCFWHQEDDYTITSQGIVWTHPNAEPVSNSIWVTDNLDKFLKQNKWSDFLKGVCTDYVEQFEKAL